VTQAAAPGGHKRGTPIGAITKKALQEENALLRAQLGIDTTSSYDEWAASLPQDMRDRMAARALFSCWGAHGRALKMLCIDTTGMSDWEIKQLGTKVFSTPGVSAELEGDFSDVREQRKAILARTVQISRFGDDDASLKATSLIAKIDGWITGPEVQVNVDRRTISLYNLVDQGEGRTGHGDEQQAIEDLIGGDALKILSHEPGGPERIETDSGDIRIDRAIAAGTASQRLEDL
jgi:hypothetical protein